MEEVSLISEWLPPVATRKRSALIQGWLQVISRQGKRQGEWIGYACYLFPNLRSHTWRTSPLDLGMDASKEHILEVVLEAGRRTRASGRR